MLKTTNRNKGLYWLHTSILALALLGLSNQSQSDAFGQQNLTFDALPMISIDPINPELMTVNSDDNARFNAAWMMQQQPGSKNREGGAAIGKLLRMSFKSAYKGFRNSGKISQAMPDEEGNGAVANMDYKVRLNSNAIKFRLKYQF